MRIIAGDMKGRKLRPVRGKMIRPTSDRLRESVFNILGDRVVDAVVLDLFAGTGALGIEALSRGARCAVFVDRFREALSAVADNLRHCEMEARSRVIRWNIMRGLSCIRDHQPRFTLVFMDPPYQRNLVQPALAHLVESRSLSPESRIIVEHSVGEPSPEFPGPLVLADQRRYGKSLVSFYNCGMEGFQKGKE